MNQVVTPPQERGNTGLDYVRDDEIDLLALMGAVAKTWKVVFVAVLIVSLAYIAFVVIGQLGAQSEVVYSKPVKLTFEGVEDAKYPNGSRFDFGDIIAPAVVQQVFESEGVEAYGVTAGQLQSGLLVEPYAPQYEMVVEKYNKKLGNKKLSFEQVGALEAQLKAELKQATKGAVIISLRLEGSPISEAVAARVINSLLSVWADSAVRDRGVLDLDIQLATSKSLDNVLFDKVDYIVMGDLLDEKISQVQDNITKLSALDGAATTQDPETGLRLADLKLAVGDLDRYVVDELMSPIRSLGLTRNKALSVYFYENKLRAQKEELALFEDQAALVKQAYDAYFPASQQGQASGRDSLAATGLYAQAQGLNTHLSGDALDRMIDMAGAQKSEEYRQLLNQQWLGLNMEAAEVKSSMRETQTLIASLKGGNVSEEQVGLRKSYLQRAEQLIPEIVEKLHAYFGVTQRIYRELSLESVGGTQKLYAPISHKLIMDEDSFDVKRGLLIWIALMFLTVLVVVPVAMVRNAIKGRREVVGS